MENNQEVKPGFSCTTQARVRYSETDQMGVVYYGNYAAFYEVGRVEAMRKLGISYRGMEETGIMMPVLEYYIKYIRPAKYDDLLYITTYIKEMPGTRVRFDYEIHNEEGTLLNFGYTVLVFVDMAKNKPVQAPASITEALKAYL